MTPKLYHYLIKLSDGSFKKIKANYSILDRYNEGTATFWKGKEICDPERKLIFTAFDPVSIEILK